ncbi:dihydrofolate synthase [Paludibacter jiangxiensis]|uniref:Dihydrofolate synthase/folylpolyglutamate synthase n=2 Tax=Paludibacter jiangxiensis TaxID=681398 RepID=A0A161LHS3_9BACT|nr:dihydrofolate synthase [Paludibacter jiangxiensis]
MRCITTFLVMNYQETIHYLYNCLPVFQHQGASAYKPGLERTIQLDNHLGNPHRKYRTIHVAGTNGKGSVSHFLAAILQSAGYKTGLYTSPHLKDFRERIKVNGEMIPEQAVIDFVENHRAFFEPIQPSFFELTMEMAFDWFATSGVDVAVIEVGLGGRLDSTNIISPGLSVITNISFDHMQFLGDTLPKIAFEKAGIMKPEIPVVIGEAEGEVKDVFVHKAEEIGTSLFFAEDTYKLTPTSDGFACEQYPNLEVQLKGLYQQKNVATVLTAVDRLRERGFDIQDDALFNGLKHVVDLTGLMGRWQILQKNPTMVCDTGHNEAGIRFIVQQLSKQKYTRLHIVFGMVNDKDISTVLSLLPQNAIYYFTQAAIPRAMEASKLRDLAQKFNLHGKIFASVASAVEAAKQAANEDDLIYIGGSTFVVAEAI